MELSGIKAKSLKVGLPFGLGSIEFEANEAEQRAAWSLYVEMTTRILRYNRSIPTEGCYARL